MPIDSSIYSQLQPLDIMGSVEKGMKMRDLVDDRELKKKKLQKEAAVEDAYKQSYVTNPDGSVSLDQKRLLSGLAKLDPAKAMEQEQKFKAQGDEDIKRKMGQFDMIAQLAGSATDQASYDAAKMRGKDAGLDISGLPAQYDPNLVKSYMKSALTAKEQLGHQLQVDQFAENKRQFGVSKNLEREKMQHDLKVKAAEAGYVDQRQANAQAHDKEMQGLKGKQQMDVTQARLAAIADKAREKAKNSDMSVAQAKQQGLYKLGMQAEQQYRKAVSTPNEYNPTQVGQIIDHNEYAPNFMKNDKAIEAQAAQANWVEAFLRDASGAAIPPSERGAYAKDFFPQPGDTAQVIANKEAMRKQKMENALIAAGGKADSSVPDMIARPQTGGASSSWGVDEANAGEIKRFKTNEIDWAE